MLCNDLPTCNSKSIAEKQQENLPRLQAKLLIVEGNIAAGKSIFSQRLGKQFGFLVRGSFVPSNIFISVHICCFYYLLHVVAT